MSDFNLETTAGQLLSALRAVKPAMGAKVHPRIPMLECVRIGQGDVRATDLDIEMSTSFAFKRASGAALIQYDPLVSLLAAMPLAEEIKIRSASECELRWRRNVATIPAVQDVEEFPILWREAAPISTVEIDDVQFRRALDAVRRSILTEETRYYLNGACFDTYEGRALLVSTDGHRLTAVPAPAIPGRPILPTKAVDAARKLKGFTHIDVSSGKMRIRGPVTVATRLIDGEFPSWPRVIPATPPTFRLTLDMGDLRPIFRAARGPGRRLRESVTILAERGNPDVVATTRHPDIGAISIALDNSAASGAGSVTLNALYLEDMFRSAGTDRLTVDVGSSLDPVRIIDESHSDEILVIMPMRGEDRFSVDFLRSLAPRPLAEAAE